jgi:putative inorganic carbon (HCO3(-)) transporter
LLRWQGVLAHQRNGWLGQHLELIAGLVLCGLMAWLPQITRAGLSLLIFACGLLWLIWALRTRPGGLGPINGWLLAVLAVAVVATGFSPVPMAAFKGLMKLVSYLGVYALMRQLLATAPIWWDRITGALLAGSLLTSVIGIRQLYGDTGALARWSDANSVAQGTVRIYSTLDNPNLLGGYLLPILPLAAVALLRWEGWPRRLFALGSLALGIVALVLSYSLDGHGGLPGPSCPSAGAPPYPILAPPLAPAGAHRVAGGWRFGPGGAHHPGGAPAGAGDEPGGRPGRQLQQLPHERLELRPEDD